MDLPEIDHEGRQVVLKRRQTDFRCLLGPDTVFGFLGRFGDVGFMDHRMIITAQKL